MRICLVGTLVYDVIYPFQGSKIRSYGGIYHTLITLSVLFYEDDIIIPVTYVGKDHWDQIIQFIKQQKNISINGLIPIEDKTNKSILRYFSSSERIEISKNPFPTLTYEHIAPFLDSDLLAINMISGWDIDLNILKDIRRNYKGEIYIDLHSYLTQLDKNGQRFHIRPEDVDQWLLIADIIQMNGKEFNILNREQLDIADFCLKYCISERKLINLTLGASGSISVLALQGKAKSYSKEKAQNVHATDPTGCGDAFMAGFIFGYIMHKNINYALDVANCVASLYSEFPGAPDIKEFYKNVKQRCLI
jgi:sugar/nucleoside kinase (ribokinase family)